MDCTVAHIIFTGSRTWKCRSCVECMVQYSPTFTMYPPVIVHGGARGADTFAAESARGYGIPQAEYPYLSKFGKAGGHRRNTQMLVETKPLLVIAFRSPGVSPGTDDMVKQAQKAGVIVWLVKCPQDGEINPGHSPQVSIMD